MPADSPRMLELRRRVQTDPASIAFAQLAEECRRVGSNEEAVEICRAGLARNPGYLSARVTLGRALIELGQLDAAKDELDIVVAGVPDNLAAIRGLAEILQRRGQMNEALQYYKRALELARHDPDLEDTVSRISQAVAPVPPPQAAGPQASIEEIFNFDTLIGQLGLPPEDPAPVEAAPAPSLEELFAEPVGDSESQGSVSPPPEASAYAAEGGPELAMESPASEGGPVMLEQEAPVEDFFAEIAPARDDESPVIELATETLESAPASAYAVADGFGATSPKLAEESPASEGGPELAMESPASEGGPLMLEQEAPVEDFFAEIAPERADDSPVIELATETLESAPASAYAVEDGFGATSPKLADESSSSEGGPALANETLAIEGGLGSIELTLDDSDSLAIMERELRELEQQRELERQRAHEEQQRELERQRVHEEQQRELERQRVHEEQQRELERQRVHEEQQRAHDEQHARLALAQRRRAAMIGALENWLSAIEADRERPSA